MNYLGKMKMIAFLLLLLSANTALLAQKEEKFTLALNEYSTTDKVTVPFCTVKIMDARFGQDIIGCVAKNLSFKGMTQQKMPAVFPEAPVAYLPKVLPTVLAFDAAKPDTLVVLLKQFRIADHISSGIEKRVKCESVLNVSCSFYAFNSGRLTKLSSFDGTIAEEWPMDGDEDAQSLSLLRTQAVMSLLQQIFKARSWQPSQTSFSQREVEEGIRKRLNLPLWKEDALTAGVYKSFDEFKNNSPSVFDVQVGRQHNGEIKEVRDQNANLLEPKDFWGLCDGKDRYVSFQNGIHKLLPEGKSFRFLFYRQSFDPGSNQFNGLHYGAGTPRAVVWPLVGNGFFSADNRPEYLYLNLEDGTVHLEEVIGTAPLRKLRNKSK